MRRFTWLSHFAWLLAACGWSASEADLAVIRIMRGLGDSARKVQILHRESVNSELEVVVAENSKLGVFLQSRGDPGLIYKIAIDEGPRDCLTRVERATATDVVLSCTPEKGTSGPNRKFIYDIRAKALVKRVEYDPFTIRYIFALPWKAMLVGGSRTQVVAFEYLPDREPPFRMLTGAQAELWTRRVPITTGTVGLEQRREIYLMPREFKPAPFGPNG